MNKIRIILVAILGLVLTLACIIPVYAISAPSYVRFSPPTYNPRVRAFYNVSETNDMLFMAESVISYASNPTDYTGAQAFIFEVMDTTSSTVLLSTPVVDYGLRPVAIYQTAAQVTALGIDLVNRPAYNIRLTGNPSIFASPSYVDCSLTPERWINQATFKGKDNDELVNFLVGNYGGNGSIVQDMNTWDSPTYSYFTTIKGRNYITSYGANYFLQACKSLSDFAPTAFASSSTVITVTEPSSTNGLESVAGGNINISSQLGPRIASGFTNLGLWLGGSAIPQWAAGLFGLAIIMFVICIYVAKVTGHPQVAIIIGSMTLMIGGFLGLMPLAMAFAITLLIFILMVWFFFSRGYV